jgi:hypothetical protein
LNMPPSFFEHLFSYYLVPQSVIFSHISLSTLASIHFPRSPDSLH